MKKQGQELCVRCFFTKEGEDPQELIARSLRLFVAQSVRKSIDPSHDGHDAV